MNLASAFITCLTTLALLGCGSDQGERAAFDFATPEAWDDRGPEAGWAPGTLHFFVLDESADDLVAVTVTAESVADPFGELSRDGEPVPRDPEDVTLESIVESITSFDIPERRWDELPAEVPPTDWGRIRPTTLAGVDALKASARFRAPNGKTGTQKTVFVLRDGTFYTVQLGGTPAASVRASTPEFTGFLESWSWG